MTGRAFFSWGELFSLFPAITADPFGRKWAATNYGFVYIAKGLAAICASPVAVLAKSSTGSWLPVFYVMIVYDVVAAAMMPLFWLKPLIRRTVQQSEAEAAILKITSAASATRRPDPDEAAP